MHGLGMHYRANGCFLYVGNRVNGHKEGKGTSYYDNNVPAYEGTWSRSVPHGTGRSYKPDGSLKYEGEFKRGLEHGEGTYYYRSGMTEKGVWINGQKEGKMLFYNKDGKYLHSVKYKDGVNIENKGRCFIF